MGWGELGQKKRKPRGDGNRVGIHVQLRGQSRPQCTGPQTLWGLQVPAQGTPGAPFPPLLHSPPSGHTMLPAPSAACLELVPVTLFPFHHLNVLTWKSSRSDAVRDMNYAETKRSSHHHTPYWFWDNGRLFSCFPLQNPQAPHLWGCPTLI